MGKHAENANDDNLTLTYLGRLVPLCRAVLIAEDGNSMLYGEALRYRQFPEVPQEFNASVGITKAKGKSDRYIIGAKMDVRPWRQLAAILQFNGHDKLSRAININHIGDADTDIWVGALIRNPGKQDILDSTESRFPVQRKIRTVEGCSSYSMEVEHSSRIFGQLKYATAEYRKNLDNSEKTGLGSSSTTLYWTAVEKNLGLLFAHIEAIGSEHAVPTRDTWRRMLFKTACETYRVLCGQETPRQMKAYAAGWEKLFRKPKDAAVQSADTKEDAS